MSLDDPLRTRNGHPYRRARENRDKIAALHFDCSLGNLSSLLPAGAQVFTDPSAGGRGFRPSVPPTEEHQLEHIRMRGGRRHNGETPRGQRSPVRIPAPRWLPGGLRRRAGLAV